MKPELLELFKATAAQGPEGDEHRKAFAASLSLPLNQAIFRESSVRQIFAIDRLAPGAVCTYPKEAGTINAIVMPHLGAVPQNLITGDEVFVPTFEVASSCEWRLAFARDARFNVMEREIARMKDQILRLENTSGWAVITASVLQAKTIDNGDTSLTKALLNNMIKEMESTEGMNPDLIVIHPSRAADIRIWGATELDDTTRKEIWDNAGLGSIYGIDIMKCWDVDANSVYLFDTSKFGVMPIRSEVDVQEDPSAIRFLRSRYIGYEEIGFACFNQNAVVMGDID